MQPENILDAIKRASRSYTEAFVSCSVMMVQLDLSAFTWSHLGTAASTGLYSFIGVMIALMARPGSSDFFRAWVTGVVTMLADRFIHPPNFGEQMTEAILTGFGAFTLAIIFDLTRKKKEI